MTVTSDMSTYKNVRFVKHSQQSVKIWCRYMLLNINDIHFYDVFQTDYSFRDPIPSKITQNKPIFNKPLHCQYRHQFASIKEKFI